MASALTLSAFAVPVVKRHDSISSYANDEADKKKRMAALLGYTFNPNRDTLLEQITSMGLLEHCEPWVQNLFSLLEKEFSPHDLVKNVVKHLEYMKAEDSFSEYCYGIEELLIIRLCQQLSKVTPVLSACTSSSPPCVYICPTGSSQVVVQSVVLYQYGCPLSSSTY